MCACTKKAAVMAVSLSRCAPPDPHYRKLIAPGLTRTANCRSVRARQRQQAGTEGAALQPVADHVKLPKGEPCCRGMPLVVMPSRPSSRLRVKKGRQEPKVDSMDLEAAEWVSRVLANDPMVEVDPVTVSEQIMAEKRATMVATATISTGVPNMLPLSGSFPKIPNGVALAAGAVLVLATVAALVRALRSGMQHTSASNMEEAISSSQFGSLDTRSKVVEETIKATHDAMAAKAMANEVSTKLAVTEERPEVYAKIAKGEFPSILAVGNAAGSAILTTFDVQPSSVRPQPAHPISMPLPPSLSMSMSLVRAATLQDSPRYSETATLESSPSTPDEVPSQHLTTPETMDFEMGTESEPAHFVEQANVTNGHVFAPIPEDILEGPWQFKGEEVLAIAAGEPQDRHIEDLGEEGLSFNTEMENVAAFTGMEAPVLAEHQMDQFQDSSSSDASAGETLTAEEILRAAEIEAEEARSNAKYRALQAALPAVTIGAGAVGALAGVDGALEMVGLAATASFISYELLWAHTRELLWDDVKKVTDHKKLVSFLKNRKIVQDC